MQIEYLGYEDVIKELNLPENNLILKMKEDNTNFMGEVIIYQPKKTMPDVDSDIYEMR